MRSFWWVVTKKYDSDLCVMLGFQHCLITKILLAFRQSDLHVKHLIKMYKFLPLCSYFSLSGSGAQDRDQWWSAAQLPLPLQGWGTSLFGNCRLFHICFNHLRSPSELKLLLIQEWKASALRIITSTLSCTTCWYRLGWESSQIWAHPQQKKDELLLIHFLSTVFGAAALCGGALLSFSCLMQLWGSENNTWAQSILVMCWLKSYVTLAEGCSRALKQRNLQCPWSQRNTLISYSRNLQILKPIIYKWAG